MGTEIAACDFDIKFTESIAQMSHDNILILPINYESINSESEIRFQSEAATVKTLFRQRKIPHSMFSWKALPTRYVQNNAFEWIGPALFISAGIFSQNELAINTALGVLASYIADYFKGRSGNNVAKLTIVVEQTKKKQCKKINYEGDAEGIKNLGEIIKSIANE